jgi:hypothetical protein
MPFNHLVASLITGWNAMPDTATGESPPSAHRRADRESLEPDSVDQFDAVDTGKLLCGRVKSRFVTTIVAVQWHIAALATTC